MVGSDEACECMVFRMAHLGRYAARQFTIPKLEPIIKLSKLAKFRRHFA